MEKMDWKTIGILLACFAEDKPEEEDNWEIAKKILDKKVPKEQMCFILISLINSLGLSDSDFKTFHQKHNPHFIDDENDDGDDDDYDGGDDDDDDDDNDNE